MEVLHIIFDLGLLCLVAFTAAIPAAIGLMFYWFIFLLLLELRKYEAARRTTIVAFVLLLWWVSVAYWVHHLGHHLWIAWIGGAVLPLAAAAIQDVYRRVVNTRKTQKPRGSPFWDHNDDYPFTKPGRPGTGADIIDRGHGVGTVV